MATTVLKDFKHLKSYSKLIEKKIVSELWAMIYKPMFKDLNIKAANDSNVIIDALRKGDIFYVGTGFKAKKQFSNVVSTELIRLGAKYNKYTRLFEISSDFLSADIVKTISESVLRAQTKLNMINSFLYDIELNLDQIIDTLIFDNEVVTILDSVQGQIQKNVKHLHIIEPQLSEAQKQRIAEDYTYNMKYYIKDFVEEKVPQMRQKVQQAIVDGYREDQVEQMLQKEYGIFGRKAKFLAHNETSIMLAELKKSIYTEMGFTEFIWQTILDGRERPDHYLLHGKICSFDNPPVIDRRTGQTGLPGETYNCRCSLIPINRDSVFFDQATIDEVAKLKSYEGVMKYGPNQ